MRLRLLNTPLWLFLLCVSFIPGCELPGKPKLAAKPIAADKVVGFDALYSQNCAGCHGADGRLGPAPPLNDAIFLAIVPDRVLASVVAKGRPTNQRADRSASSRYQATVECAGKVA